MRFLISMEKCQSKKCKIYFYLIPTFRTLGSLIRIKNTHFLFLTLKGHTHWVPLLQSDWFSTIGGEISNMLDISWLSLRRPVIRVTQRWLASCPINRQYPQGCWRYNQRYNQPSWANYSSDLAKIVLKILPSSHSTATLCIMMNVSMWCLPLTAHKE